VSFYRNSDACTEITTPDGYLCVIFGMTAKENAIPSIKTSAQIQECAFPLKMKDAELIGINEQKNAGYNIDTKDYTKENVQRAISSSSSLENTLSSFEFCLKSYVSYCTTYLRNCVV
jgi:hypothetical protein